MPRITKDTQRNEQELRSRKTLSESKLSAGAPHRTLKTDQRRTGPSLMVASRRPLLEVYVNRTGKQTALLREFTCVGRPPSSPELTSKCKQTNYSPAEVATRRRRFAFVGSDASTPTDSSAHFNCFYLEPKQSMQQKTKEKNSWGT